MIPFMGTNAFSSVQPFVGLRHNTTESTSEQRNIPTRERVMGRGEGENGVVEMRDHSSCIVCSWAELRLDDNDASSSLFWYFHNREKWEWMVPANKSACTSELKPESFIMFFNFLLESFAMHSRCMKWTRCGRLWCHFLPLVRNFRTWRKHALRELDKEEQNRISIENSVYTASF